MVSVQLWHVKVLPLCIYFHGKMNASVSFILRDFSIHVEVALLDRVWVNLNATGGTCGSIC